jgi:hypothetical protein
MSCYYLIQFNLVQFQEFKTKTKLNFFKFSIRNYQKKKKGNNSVNFKSGFMNILDNSVNLLNPKH